MLIQRRGSQRKWLKWIKNFYECVHKVPSSTGLLLRNTHFISSRYLYLSHLASSLLAYSRISLLHHCSKLLSNYLYSSINNVSQPPTFISNLLLTQIQKRRSCSLSLLDGSGKEPTYKYYRSFGWVDVSVERETKEYTTSVENRRNHYLPRELAIVLFDGCIVELRAFVTANRGSAQYFRLSFAPIIFLLYSVFVHRTQISLSFSPLSLPLSSYISLRANRFDSYLANESTFPPNRQNKSSPSYNVDDFVTMRVCSASDLRTNK